MAFTFILSDSSINESGYRILTSGINLKQFKKNPVMFYNHHRSSNWDKPKLLPIGVWKNIRVEGDRLLADAEFDMEDTFAAEVARKVEKKHLQATSVGIRVIETSREPKHLEKGQTRPTVTKSKLLEVSIVDIPRNGNALRLSYGDDILEHSLGDDKEQMNNILPLIESTNNLGMKGLFEVLGLGANATEIQAVTALTQLKNDNKTLQSKVANLSEQLEQLKSNQQEEKCQALVTAAISAKKITEEDKETWLDLAKNNYEGAKKALDKMKGFTTLSSQVNSSKTNDTTLSDAELFEAKFDAGEIAEWEKNNPEEYKRCMAAYEALE